MAYSNSRGKIIYEGYGDHRGRTGHALVFFYYPANGLTNPDAFLPKPPCIFIKQLLEAETANPSELKF